MSTQLVRGIDLSFANGDGGSKPMPDWSKIAGDADVRFVYQRACYGDIAADDDGDVFVHNHDGAKAHGIKFAAYTFVLRWRDPIAQADHFLQAIDGRQGDNRPWIDVEEGSFEEHGDWKDVNANIAWLAAISQQIEKHLCMPDIYTNADTWATYFGNTPGFAGHRFGIANYTGKPGQLAIPGGIPTSQVMVHQFADDGIVPGIIGHVDLDALMPGLDLSVLAR